MNKRRALRNEFVRSYFGATLGPLGTIPLGITRDIHALKTVVVDTPHLTNGYQTFESSWVLQAGEMPPEEVAYRATAASRGILASGLHEALTTRFHDLTEPAAAGSNDVEWSSWYHGASFQHTITGSVEEVAKYCDLTENEREQIVIQARSMAHGDHIVYGAAHGISSHTAPQTGEHNFTGLVVTSLHLASGTTSGLAALRERGIRVVYMTGESEDLATYVTNAAHLNTHAKVARHAAYAQGGDHTIYAHIDRVNARRIVTQLPQPTVILRHPVAEFVHMLDACR